MPERKWPWELDLQQYFPDNPLDPNKALGNVLGQVGGVVSQVEDAVTGTATPSPAPAPSPVPAPPAPPPMKAQVRATQNGLEVVKMSSGTVGFFDKVKGYYKGVIVVIGSILIILNQVTPIFDFLGGNSQHWFNVVVAAATTVLTILKSNEQWVDKLPS